MKKAFFTLSIACLAAFALNAQTPSSATIKPGTGTVPKAKETSTKATPSTTKAGSEKSSATPAKSTAEKAKPSTTKTSAAPAEKASVTPTTTKVSAAPAAAPGEAKDYVKFDKFVHDYGTVKKGANGDCEFTYKNTSKEPLIITSCYGSCGCTVPKWSKEPLLPGQSETIKVHYDTNRPGGFEKTVTVNFQNHTEPTTLKIKGTVETPPADVPFGTQPANTGAPLEKGNN